jgi:chorismate dehydratase
MAAATPRTRLGIVSYLAARPCVEGLSDHPLFEIFAGTPAPLAESLHGGRLDCALVSVIEGFRRPGYRYAPGLCIGADGLVQSVLLFSIKPLRECATLALDDASRSGAALAQICLRETGNTHFRIVSRGESPDAWLRIGDQALLEAARAAPDPSIQIHDLAALWKSLTGLPFVFAVWLVRPGFELRRADAEALRAARDAGCARRHEIANEASGALGLPATYLYRYVTESCRYDLDAPGMVDGMRHFYRKAVEHGLAPAGMELEPARLLF